MRSVYKYSQLSPWGQLAITDTPLKQTVAKSPKKKTNYRRFTEINSRCHGLSLKRTLSPNPYVSAVKRADCSGLSSLQGRCKKGRGREGREGEGETRERKKGRKRLLLVPIPSLFPFPVRFSTPATQATVYPLIPLGRLEIHIVFLKPTELRFQSPFFGPDIEPDTMLQLQLIKQETE